MSDSDGRNPLERELDEAVKSARDAISAPPTSEWHRSDVWQDLSEALRARYLHWEGRRDLDEAVDAARRSLEAAPSHERRHALNFLAGVLDLRYERYSEAQDLDEVVDSVSQALGEVPKDSDEFSSQSTLVALALRARYAQSQRRPDLDAAIATCRQALELRGDTDVNLAPPLLDNLAVALCLEFELTGDVAVVEDAWDCIERLAEIGAIQALSTAHWWTQWCASRGPGTFGERVWEWIWVAAQSAVRVARDVLASGVAVPVPALVRQVAAAGGYALANHGRVHAAIELAEDAAVVAAASTVISDDALELARAAGAGALVDAYVAAADDVKWAVVHNAAAGEALARRDAALDALEAQVGPLDHAAEVYLLRLAGDATSPVSFLLVTDGGGVVLSAQGTVLATNGHPLVTEVAPQYAGRPATLSPWADPVWLDDVRPGNVAQWLRGGDSLGESFGPSQEG